MADEILAGRLTVDTKNFTQKIDDAVAHANKALAGLGKEVELQGNNGNKKQLTVLQDMTKSVRELTSHYREYNNAMKAGNEEGVKLFQMRIEQDKAHIEHLREENRLGKQSAEQYQKAQTLIQNEARKSKEAMDALAKSVSRGEVAKASDAYRTLATAIGEYNKAKATGNTSGMEYWQRQITASHQMLENTKANLDTLKLEGADREKIAQTIERGANAYQGFVQSQEQSVNITANLANTWDRVWQKLRLITGLSLVKVFHDAMQYAKEFDAAIIDIGVITQQTADQARGLGDVYREMAAELQVSSTSIAKSAATIYRQGFRDAEQIEKIVAGATKYGAVTRQSVDEAFQSMTATIQNFGKDTQDIGKFVEHIGDVWSYMGDSVATTGTEVGLAMDKMAASIQSVGVSFEKASSWAAIMLARTQQAGQVVGSQMNALVARYAKITSKGFASITQDDEGEDLSFNDVSKALQQAGIQIYDAISKSFMPMDQMMDTLSQKWGTLDEATRKYIATALGGTRGMNYLLTLLNNYNDALELEGGVIDGLVNSKYETWLDGVEAAQNDLSNSMENLYSILSTDVLTGFYHGMANLVDIFTGATQAVGGLNLTLPVLAAGIFTVASAIGKIISLVNQAKAISSVTGLLEMLTTGKIGLIVMGVAAAATAIGAIITGIGKAVKSVKEYYNSEAINMEEINEKLAANEDKIKHWKELGAELDAISEKTGGVNGNMEEFVRLRAELVKGSPFLQAKYGEEGEQISSLTELQSIYNSELATTLDTQRAISRIKFEELDQGYLKYLSDQKKESWVSGTVGYGGISQMKSELDRGYGENMNYARLVAAKKYLETAAKELEIEGTEYEDTFNEVWDRITVLYNQKTEEMQSEKQKIAKAMIGMFSDAEQNLLFYGDDNFMSQILTSLAESDLMDTDAGYEAAKDIAVRIGKAYTNILKDGMSEGAMVALSEPWLDAGMQGWNISLITSFMENWQKGMEVGNAISDSWLSGVLAQKIENAWTPAILNAFVMAADDIRNNPELDEIQKNTLLTDLVKDWIEADDTDLVSLVEGALLGEDASGTASGTNALERLKNIKTVIRELTDEFADLKDAKLDLEWSSMEGNSPLSADRIEALAKKYKDDAEFLELLFDYERAIAGLGDMDTARTALIDYMGAMTSYTTQVEAATEKTDVLRDAIYSLSGEGEGMLSVDQLTALGKEYESLIPSITAYANAMDSGVGVDSARFVLFDELKNIAENQDIATGLERMKDVTDMIEKLASGDYDLSDIQSAQEMLGLAGESIQNLTVDGLIDMLTQQLAEDTEQWGALAEALGLFREEAQDLSEQIANLVHPMNDAQKAVKKLSEGDQLTIDEIENLLKAYPDLADEITAYGKDTKNTTKLVDQLNKHLNEDAVNDWADAIESAIKTLDNAEAGTREYDKAMVNLAKSFDFRGLGQMDSLDFVAANLENIRAAANGSAEAFRALQEAAWVNIVGTSSVDFSNILNGIALVGEDANRLGDTLVALGYFETETKELDSTQQVITGITRDMFGMANGVTTDTMTLNGTYRVLKPTSQNPFKSAGGGGKSGGGGGGGGKKGGGGGGGSGTVNVSEATQKMVDDMEKQQDQYDNRLKLIGLKKEYREIRGEIQGVIGLTEQERDVIREQSEALQENIDKLQAEIDAQEAIVNANKEGSKKYKQAAKDLEELTKLHQEYSEKLLENTNRLEEIKKELRELEEQARQTVIAVEDLIRETLEAEESLRRDMLDNTVDMEDTIFEAIKARYEREQELVIETQEKKKEALQDEIDKIDELIKAREKLLKKEKEEQDIAELQAKIARIAADPTRRKELMQLQEELAEKQKDQAWDTYKEELEAQKETLNDEIDNIDDYIDEVNKYYEELFKNPEKLLKETAEVMKKTDEEIIQWLKENTEEWNTYSDNRRQQAEEDWQATLDAMRGITETYKDQIQEIMSWSDENIIQWLKEHNIDFKNGTDAQQASFLKSWIETLEAWRNAYKRVADEVSTISYPSPDIGSGGGGGGGSGGGGGGGYYGGGGYSGGGSSGGSGGASPNVSINTATADPTRNPAPKPVKYTKTAVYKYVGYTGRTLQTSANATSTNDGAAIIEAKKKAFNSAKTAATKNWATGYKSGKAAYMDYSRAIANINKAAWDKNSGYLWFDRAYKYGGIADFTGPAWLDGTPQMPERILTGEQNMLFEELVRTLQAIKTVSVGGFNGYSGGLDAAGGRGLTIESIVINAAGLESDADFEAIADKVGEAIERRISRTVSIGGIRI